MSFFIYRDGALVSGVGSKEWRNVKGRSQKGRDASVGGAR